MHKTWQIILLENLIPKDSQNEITRIIIPEDLFIYRSQNGIMFHFASF